MNFVLRLPDGSYCDPQPTTSGEWQWSCFDGERLIGGIWIPRSHEDRREQQQQPQQKANGNASQTR